jgi:hypothetical protein
VAATRLSQAEDLAEKAVEVGRRAVPGHVRPSFQEAEKVFRGRGESTAAASA